MSELSVGEIVEVVVTRLEPYGAWVEYAGESGLVTIPEVSWSRISHPGNVLAVGDRLQAKILTRSEGTFAASIRMAHPERDPWYDPNLFAVGTEFEAPVVSVLEYGAFLEIRPEVRGLLHKACWPRPLTVGDLLRVRVMAMDRDRRKLELELAKPIF